MAEKTSDKVRFITKIFKKLWYSIFKKAGFDLIITSGICLHKKQFFRKMATGNTIQYYKIFLANATTIQIIECRPISMYLTRSKYIPPYEDIKVGAYYLVLARPWGGHCNPKAIIIIETKDFIKISELKKVILENF